MDPLSKLQGKYGAKTTIDPWTSYCQHCREVGCAPMDRQDFDARWSELVASKEAWEKLRVLMRQHAGFRVQNGADGSLNVRIQEDWGRENGEMVWHMWELTQQAAPWIVLVVCPER